MFNTSYPQNITKMTQIWHKSSLAINLQSVLGDALMSLDCQFHSTHITETL